MGVWSQLLKEEKKSFWLHLLYSVFEGAVMGGILLNEFIFLKSMHGSEVKLAALFVIINPTVINRNIFMQHI